MRLIVELPVVEGLVARATIRAITGWSGLDALIGAVRVGEPAATKDDAGRVTGWRHQVELTQEMGVGAPLTGTQAGIFAIDVVEGDLLGVTTPADWDFAVSLLPGIVRGPERVTLPEGPCARVWLNPERGKIITIPLPVVGPIRIGRA
jgi:hypothetical protein